MSYISRKNNINKIIFTIVFWLIVFLLNIGPDWYSFSSAREIFERIGTVTLLQAFVAYSAIYYLVPKFLDQKKLIRFIIGLLVVLLIASEINIFISYFYLEGTYPDTYGAYYKSISHYTLLQRMGFSHVIKFILFSKFPHLFFPAAILIAITYYQKQQSLLELREQKKTAELTALKNQLNPHFIFNTLNNIYALAIKRSELTAEAVAKLSGILDYVLYRCNESYVLLSDEITMIKDYVALEKFRFGDRIQVNIKNNIQESIKVAPLLFLTLIENAFKHGASQELRHARIDILLEEKDNMISFQIKNTKPAQTRSSSITKETIGLNNLRKQLDLLYPDNYNLEFLETTDDYTAILSLRKVNK